MDGCPNHPMSRTCRAWIYAIGWLPPAIYIFYMLPHFDPILEKLDEAGELSPLTNWVWTCSRVNQGFFYLPAVVGLVMLIALAEFILVVTRSSQLGRVVWTTVVLGTGFVAVAILVKASMLPVFVNPGSRRY